MLLSYLLMSYCDETGLTNGFVIPIGYAVHSLALVADSFHMVRSLSIQLVVLGD